MPLSGTPKVSKPKDATHFQTRAVVMWLRPLAVYCVLCVGFGINGTCNGIRNCAAGLGLLSKGAA